MEQNQIREEIPEQKKIKKRILLAIIIIVIILTVTLGIKTAFAINGWKTLITEMSTNKNSVVKDIGGNVIAEIGSEKAKETISSAEIPNNLKNAYVSIEDERFYKHNGVDVKRTGAAIVSYIIHRGSYSFGGSSITQQVVKNLTGDSSGKVTRKVKEWGKAIILDSTLDKDEILSLYLNVIYVGPNIYGIETGSKYYFNKSAKNLALEECAFLAGINNSPNSYNPYGDTDNTEKIKKRTKTVLSKMKELNYINESDYNTAVANVENGLNFKKGKIETNDAIYSYHTDALINDLIEDISVKKKITKTFATNYVNMAGLVIYSTQDSDIQSKMEKEFEKTKYELASNTGGKHSQSAMVIIDHKTGQVVGCVGGLGKKETSRGLNRATQSIRQTGSCIKPIAVLVPGIAEKKFTGSTIYLDEKTTFQGNYSPENYSNYLGDITVRRALESSQNIPFVEMMKEIGPETSIKYLEKMGITTLDKNDETLALALGGLDKGISPLQMASAYATIANDGVYIEPIFYTQVETNDGKIILTPKQKKKKVFSKDVAYIVKELLTEPVKGKHGTASYCAISGIDVSAKTGTTDNNYDRWLCGFTPYYTGATWYGYDKNETINFQGKKNPAGIIWANVMSRIHINKKDAKFEKPNDVIKITVCSKTGKSANTGCSNTYDEYFLSGTVPEKCDVHVGNKVKDENTTKPSNDSFDTTTKDDVDVITRPKTEENTQQDTTNNNNNTTIEKPSNNNNVTNNTSVTNTTNNNNTNANNTNRTDANSQNNTNSNSNRNNNTNNTNTTNNNNVSNTNSNSDTNNTTNENVNRTSNNT